MIHIINETDVPVVYKTGIGVSNFTPEFVYTRVENLPQPIPGTELTSLSDYLDLFSRQRSEIELPPIPVGIFALKTLEENKLFRVTYDADRIGRDDVLQFINTLPL